MSTTTPLTAEELLHLADRPDRCELIEGELRMMSPSGWLHGMVVGRLQTLLGRHVYDHQLGEIFGAETGFILQRNRDTVRAPDIAFISQQNLPDERPEQAFWPGAPDLVVEVLSPNDKLGEVDEKIAAWLNAGARLLWIVDPQLENVTCYRSATEVEVRTRDQSLDGADVLPGFVCDLTQIFAVR